MDIFSCYQVPALLNTRDEGRGGGVTKGEGLESSFVYTLENYPIIWGP